MQMRARLQTTASKAYYDHHPDDDDARKARLMHTHTLTTCAVRWAISQMCAAPSQQSSLRDAQLERADAMRRAPQRLSKSLERPATLEFNSLRQRARARDVEKALR